MAYCGLNKRKYDPAKDFLRVACIARVFLNNSNSLQEVTINLGRMLGNTFVDADKMALINSIITLLVHVNKMQEGEKRQYINDIFSGNIVGEPGEFSSGFDPHVDINAVNVIDVDDAPVLERATDFLKAKATFISRSKIDHPQSAFNTAVSHFTNRIVESIIYDKTSHLLRNANEVLNESNLTRVNHEILKYRLELMSTLYNALHKEIATPKVFAISDFQTDSDLNNAISRILQEYQILLDNDTYAPDPDTFEAYAILLHFDNLLKSEFSKVIDVNAKYADGRIGLNMYTFLGGHVQFDDSFSDESADAGDYSSKIVKQLLDYFKRKHFDGYGALEDTDRGIGFNAFTNLMARVKDFIEDGSDLDLKALLYEPINERGNKTWIDAINKYLTEKSKYLSTGEIEALYGIRDNVMSSTGILQRIFENQIAKVITCRYLQVMPILVNGVYQMGTREMSESLRDSQNFNVQRMVQSSIYRFEKDPALARKIFAKHGIEVIAPTGGQGEYRVKINSIKMNNHGASEPIPATIKFYFPNAKENTTYKIQASDPNYTDADKSELNANVIEPLANIIKDLFGFPMPETLDAVVEKVGKREGYNLYDGFASLVGLTALLSHPDHRNLRNSPAFKYKNGIFNTARYKMYFDTAAGVMYDLYSTRDSIVIKNSEGNALPNFQIISDAYEIKRKIYMANRDNTLRNGIHKKGDGKPHKMYEKNPIVVNNMLGHIYMRGEIKNGNQTKSSNQLTKKEVLYLDIVENFYKRLSVGKSILMQYNCFSDKKTHFLAEYLLKNGGMDEDFKDWITSAQSPKRLAELRTTYRNKIIEYRKDRTQKQWKNIFERYEYVYNLASETKGKKDYDDWVSIETFDESDASNYEKNIKFLRNFVKDKRLNTIRTDFRQKGVDFNENLDIFYSKNDKTCDMNYMLIHEAEMYIINPGNFDDYWEFHKRQFAKGLAECGFKFDKFYDSGLGINLYDNSEWDDTIAKTSKAFLAKKGEIETTDIDNADTVELHPIIEAYMYANALLNGALNDIAFGPTNGFANKYDGESLRTAENNPLYVNEENETQLKQKATARFNVFIHYEAAKLLDETKRTVFAGAVKAPYALGLKYGVANKWKCTAIDMGKAYCHNLYGEVGKIDPRDGEGDASPYVARQTNESLLDAPVGLNKKTIGGQIDPETGTFQEIKWAEFAIRNQFRRESLRCEKKFRLMHNLNFDAQTKQRVLDNIILFYDLNETHYDPEYNNRKITQTDYLYYKDRATRKFYRIDKIDTFGNQVVRTVTEVNASGEVITNNGKTNTFDKKLDVNSIYDIDNVYGGAYCMTKQNGRLVYSENNFDIVTNIIGYCNLNDFFIAYAIDATAFKVGLTNVNSNSVFDPESNEPLNYFEISSAYFGVQMNADHELEEAKVSEMTQMMQALMQAAQKANVVDEIYKLVGEIALENIREYRELIDSGDDVAIYEKLGEMFITNFLNGSASENSLSLADAFIVNAAKSLKFKNLDNKIPFSSNQIKSIFEATITSTFNKLGIRRKYAGFGGINAPSYESFPVYLHPDGKITDKDTLDDQIYAHLEKTGELGVWNVENVYTQQCSNPDGEIDNPFIKRIMDRTNIQIEDTIIIRKKGTKGPGKIIRVQDIMRLDFICNMLPFDYEVYKWTIAPRELRQSLDRITIDNNGHSSEAFVTDLDITRAAFYCNNKNWEILTDWIKDQEHPIIDENDIETVLMAATDERNEVIANALKECSDMGYDSIQGYYKKGTADKPFEINEQTAIKWLNHKQQELLNSLDASGSAVTTVYGEKVTIRNYRKSSAQMIIGQTNAKEFNLRKGDKLRDVLQKGWKFFRDRLGETYSDPTDIERANYDGILYNLDGTKSYILVLNSGDNIPEGFQINAKYQQTNGQWTKDGETICGWKDVTVWQAPDGHDVFVVTGKKAYSSLIHSKAFKFHRTLINANNLQRLAHWDSLINESRDVWASIDDYQKLEQREFEKQINQLAQKQYYAFEAHLQHVVTRIPSQSMQSFMDMEVVMWAETDMNETYVSRSVTWIQGSDYDIDKDYVLSFKISEDGTLETLSDLQDETHTKVEKDGPSRIVYFDPYKIASLIAPNGNQFKQVNNSTIKLSYEDVLSVLNDGNIEVLNKVLQQTTEKSKDKIGISFESMKEFVRDPKLKKEENDQALKDYNVEFEAYEIAKRRIIELLNIHNKSVRQGKRLKNGLQNTCVKHILDILRAPSSQMYMSQPITMDNIRAVGDKSTLAEAEKTISLDNPYSIFMMQEQNMVGREVIGVGATSLKHYFAASTFMHRQATKMENILLNAVNGNRELTANEQNNMISLFFDLVFDSKIDNGVATIANLYLDKILVLLGQYKQKHPDFIFTYNNPDVPEMTIEEAYKVNGNGQVFNLKDEHDQNYINGRQIDLFGLMPILDVASNGTWWNPVRAISTYSELISAATDNAKELILSKINAGTKTADVYTYLLSTGVRFEDAAKIMMSDAVKLANMYTQSNIYDNTIQFASFENAINFVLDRKPLDGIDQTAYEKFFENKEIWQALEENAIFKKELEDLRKDLNDYINTHDVHPNSDDNVTKYVPYRSNNVESIYTFAGKTDLTDSEQGMWDTIRPLDRLSSAVKEVLQKDSKAILKALIPKIQATERVTGPDTFDPGVEALIEMSYDQYDIDSSASLSTSYNIGYDLNPRTALRFYKYFQDYVIPKNERLQALRDKAAKEKQPDPEAILINLVDNILPGIAEQRIHGQILSINQGLNTSDYDEFRWMYNVERFINTRYFNGEEACDFDMVRFIKDATYRQEQIKKYERFKSSVNILKCITNVEHFWAMIQIAGVNRAFIERSSAIRIERDLAKRLLSNSTLNPQYQSLNSDEFKELSRVVSDSIFYNWINTLSLAIPEINFQGKEDVGNDYRPEVYLKMKDGKIVYTPLSQNINDGLFKFKKLMEGYVIPKLIADGGETSGGVKNIGKQFVMNLVPDVRIDSTTKQPYTFQKPTISLADASKSPKLDIIYAAIAKDFNELCRMKADNILGTDCGWTYGDLFYLYNLLLTRDSIGGNSLTKLFEEFTTSNDRNSLVYQYNQFLGELDNGTLRWTTPSTDLINKDRIRFGSVVIDMRDVRFRCGSISKKGKFGVKHIKDENNNPTVKLGNDGLPINMSRDDHPINLPFLSDSMGGIATKIERIKPKDNTIKELKLNDREIFNAVLMNLRELTGNKLDIIVYNGDELLEDDPRRSAKGYMSNSKIYLNEANIDASTPIHEFMHIICATMKYGTPAQRNMYYKLLKEVTTAFDDKTKEKREKILGLNVEEFWKPIWDAIMAENGFYRQILTGSDLQEEVLVNGLAKAFENGLMKNEALNKDIREGRVTPLNVSEEIRLVMRNIFKLQSNEIGKMNINDLGNKSLETILRVFNNQMTGNASYSIAYTAIPTNQKIARVKRFLENRGDLSINGDC